MIFLIIITLFKLGFGWNSFAHSMIARIAELDLSNDPKGIATLKKVYETLYKLTPFFPEVADSLLEVAVTPDALNFNFKGFLAGYHYKDIPEIYKNENEQINLPTESEVNADYAIASAIEIIKDSLNPKIGANRMIKKGFMDSLMTRYLIHLVGDVHQPLHTISLYSKLLMQGTIAKGDTGGNLILINDPYKSGSKNLHSFWDSGLGLFPNVRVFPYPLEEKVRINEMAVNLMKEFPKSYYGSDVTQLNHKSWIEESHKVAVQIAYADVDLFPTIRPEYVVFGRKLTKERVTLAGYRLANILRDIFK